MGIVHGHRTTRQLRVLVVGASVAVLAAGLRALPEQASAGTPPEPVESSLLSIPPTTIPPAVALADLAYGPGARHRMDLFVPAGPGPHPVMVWAHGGGWHTGDKGDFPRQLRDALLEAGFAFATINYRLAGDPPASGRPEPPAVVHPAPVHDVLAALEWLRRSADRHRLDPDSLVTAGHSAGGHLAVMAAIGGAGAPVGPGGHPPGVRGAVVFGAPLDMPLIQGTFGEWGQRVTRGLLGCAWEAPCDLRPADPRSYLDPADVPIAVVSGSSDGIVPTAHAESFAIAADAVGYPRLTIRVEPGLDHGGVFLQPDTEFVLGWLRDQLG